MGRASRRAKHPTAQLASTRQEPRSTSFGLEGFGPVLHLLQAFHGLAFGTGDDQPLRAGVPQAIDHGFGSAGEVLARLPRPKAHFEPARIAHPGLLLGVQPRFEHGVYPLVEGYVVLYFGLFHKFTVLGVFGFSWLGMEAARGSAAAQRRHRFHVVTAEDDRTLEAPLQS